MTTSDIASIIEINYPKWDQDTKDFYLEFLSQIPHSYFIEGFKLGINLDTQFTDENNSNIAIIKFTYGLPQWESIISYLQGYIGEDLNNYYTVNNHLILEMAY